MVQVAAIEGEGTPPPRRRRRPSGRLLRHAAGPVALLLILLAGVVAGLDTDAGHRFLADRIAALKPATGLRIRVGRIDGSLWGGTRLRDLRLYDPRGLFLEAPEVALDWHPLGWLDNRLDIDRLASDLVILHRLPRLRPTGRQAPVLPGFDIRIGTLDARLRVEPAVAGRRQLVRLAGRGDVRDRRALVALTAGSTAGDRLRLLLDAAPDRDRFDLDARATGPAGGVLGGLAGTRRPLALAVAGDGSWRRWRGRGRLDIAGARIADLALGASDGRYTLDGMLKLASITHGKLQRLTAPRVAIRSAATLADRRLTGTLDLRSAALAARFDGTVDLGRSAFDRLRIAARLLRPPALFPNMTGSDVRLAARLDGAFPTATLDYRLTSPRFAFDNTGFEQVRAEGRTRLGHRPFRLPVRMVARRVTGVGTVAGGILANLSVEGMLTITPKLLTGNGLALKSDKLSGRLGLLVDLVTGDYRVMLSGGLSRYLIPGLGIVDVTTDLDVVPGPGGRGTRVVGRGRAWVRRFDNAFLRSLAGGLPRLETLLERDAAGVLHFSRLLLTAPSIRIAGTGLRRRDGTFLFKGQGRQASYGAFDLGLDGDIARPIIDLLLARPVEALGLDRVRLHLDPTPEGFAYTAAGGSTLGPFASDGAVVTPPGAPAEIRVATLAVSGTRGRGAVRSLADGFDGALDVAGGGIDGTIRFAPDPRGQRIAARLALRDATLAAATPILVRRGTVDGQLRLDPAGAVSDVTLSGQGLRRGGVSLARLAAHVGLAGGRGELRAAFAGSRGRAFDLQTVTAVAPDRLAIRAQGTIDRRAIAVDGAAVLTRDGEGWRLAPTGVRFSGGSASVAGRFGGGPVALQANLSAMPLTVLDLFYPGLGLGGTASGSLRYEQASADVLPQARAELKVRGLTRSGLVLSSQPVDMGVAAVLQGQTAAARAVVASAGRVIGRAQARLAPLAPSGDLWSRLSAAPLFAQLRYGGPADTLWRLTGVETIDVSGPVALGADVGGTLAAPRIRGSLATGRARLESGVTGTVVENIAARGRFDGSRLVIDSFTGTTRGDGRVAGRAAFDFAAANGFGIDVALTARRALLLDRDDIGATVSGPLRLTSDGAGGQIAGEVTLDRSRFRLGRATAAELPRLAVNEVNRPADEAPVTRVRRPWSLDLRTHAPNRLFVSGLGLDSEWRADLAIKGTVENPAITGQADLVRGNYEFAGRRFDIDRGQIRFTGSVPVDPALDITAGATINNVSATIRVTGTGLKPEIDFTSTPALPEDELLSRLLFGTSITNLSAPEALQLAAAVASLRAGGGDSLNPINAVRRAVGLDRLRILPADVTTGQKTSVGAGKYLGRRTYVEVISDGAGYSATRVEFQITRWLALLSTISTIGRQSVNVRVSKDY